MATVFSGMTYPVWHLLFVDANHNPKLELWVTSPNGSSVPPGDQEIHDLVEAMATQGYYVEGANNPGQQSTKYSIGEQTDPLPEVTVP